jgi:hypothetical protein
MTRTKPLLTDALLLIALLAAAAAYWAPWVGHPSAALKLSGQDLGEFVKFIPTVGPTFPRQLFYLPPLVCSLCLVLLSSVRGCSTERGVGYPRWVRAGMLAGALLLLPGLLPPAWGHPKELLTPEFRLQGLAVIAGLTAVLGHGLLHRIPMQVTRLLVVSLSALALVLPQAAFWLIRSRLWSVYNTPAIHLGWGLWLHLVAWLVVMVAAWWASTHETAAVKSPERSHQA